MSRHAAEGHKTLHKNKIFQPQEKVIEVGLYQGEVT